MELTFTIPWALSAVVTVALAIVMPEGQWPVDRPNDCTAWPIPAADVS